MAMHEELGTTVLVEATVFSNGAASKKQVALSTEVPFTIMADDTELATLLVTPADLTELTTGYLFTSGFISAHADIKELTIDTGRWVAYTRLAREPDPALMRKRLFSASCGRCALYSSVVELGMRSPCASRLRITPCQIAQAVAWIESSSGVFTRTGGVHAAGFYDPSNDDRQAFDDVARHNAVDKAIGRALIEHRDMSHLVLVRTGRTSSEILFKARRCGSPITVSRGAPTHQSVLLARELGITLVGFARENDCTVYSHNERIDHAVRPDEP